MVRVVTARLGQRPHSGSSGTFLPVKGHTMATVTFDRATLVYPGGTKPAVDSLDLHIDDGEFLVLVGPSGSGKSTALRMLAGLEDVTDGAIRINDKDVSQLPPKARDIAMVFQNYALYPHMSVAQNMGFALKISGVAKDEIRKRVEDAAKILDLTEFLDRKPKALSGGQRQRVAMGRAIVRSPQVFLMDEPLSNLDAKLRVQTRSQIAALQARLGTTTVYVTHDQVEAMTMGHRVAVLKDGFLQQVDTPRVLYDRPDNAFVAGFIGSPAMNLKTLPVTERGAHFGGMDIELSRERLAKAAKGGSKTVMVGFRPEAVDIVGLDGPTNGNTAALQVELVEELGSDAYVYGNVVTESGNGRVIVRTEGRKTPHMGDTVEITVNPHEVHLFNSESGLRID
jgi:multiple sugar transport system ATP-binding protein